MDVKGYESLNVDIEMDSDASPELIDKLFEQVKDRCPVNDNLSNSTPIKYNIKHLVN